MEYDTSSKHQNVIKIKTVTEKIKFRGQKITRERVVKEFKIPKIVSSDIGFQLQFGLKGNDKAYKSKSNQNTVNFDDKKILI
tara:strand:- start:1083 stop:1328 length:246 start_codon:yes stop_codon:yes gene_type:complete